MIVEKIVLEDDNAKMVEVQVVNFVLTKTKMLNYRVNLLLKAIEKVIILAGIKNYEVAIIMLVKERFLMLKVVVHTLIISKINE